MFSIQFYKIILAGAIVILSFSSVLNETDKLKRNAAEKYDTPNIVLILVDDLGYMDTYAYGSKFYETPNIDKLAKQSMMFTNAYASAANCAPSRACLLTGKNTPRHGIYTVGSSERGKNEMRKLIPTPNTTVLQDSFITLAERLQEAGYKTCSIGKWHIGDNPLTQGFDINIAGTHKGHPKSYFSPYKNTALPDGPDGEYLTDRLTDEAINFIKQNKNNKFFLYLPYYTVHAPLQGKKEIIDKYKGKKIKNGQKNVVYASMIESMDNNVGRILSTLDKLKLSENTLLVFTSDNGGVRQTSSQYPLRAGKGSYYEGGIRVPLLIRYPKKIKGATVCDVPVTNMDFFPTFINFANAKKQENELLDGENLMPLLLNEGRFDKERALFWHFPIYLQTVGYDEKDGRDPYFRTRPGSVIRKGKWKLHHYFEDNGIELYNLKKDIGETNNLVKKNPKKAKELLEILDKWRSETDAPIPTKLNPKYKPNKY